MLKIIRLAIKKTPFVGDFVKKIVRPDNPYMKKVASPAHNQVIFYHGGVAVPPIRYRDMVRKSSILPEDFILEGRQVYESISGLIRKAGGKLDRENKIFEFGVGCGRVARHFLADGTRDFIGSDVDDELIEWCNNNLVSESSVGFIVNGYEPPLAIESESFDIAYSISVFTHMTVENQKKWAAELGRIMRPGGFLLISFLERKKSDITEGVLVVERQDKEFVRGWLGKGNAPEVYFNTYNTRENMEELFSKNFDFALYSEKVIRNTQSVVILRRKEAP